MKNLVPLPYRRVSVQPYGSEMTGEAIRAHLLGREAYRRTDYVVLESNGATAVTAVTTADRENLFAPIESVEVLALPDSCVLVEAPHTDTGNPSALAAEARRAGVGVDGTLVVRGKYGHVNFIHRPDPMVIRVVDVVPPHPPKLCDLAQQVIGYADFPPIHLELECIDLAVLAAGRSRPPAYLVPCRSGGLQHLGAPVYFLDERPERREWTLLGCERSLQFHRHFYGDEPPTIEICPRRLVEARETPTLLKCCLLEFDGELDGHVAVTPWGSDVKMVEATLRRLVAAAETDR